MSHLLDDADTLLDQLRIQTRTSIQQTILGSSVILGALAERVLRTIQIQFTEAQVRQLLEQDDAMIHRVFEYGVGDSLIRDKMTGLVVQHLLQRAWPRYGDHEDIDAFYARLHAAAVRQGYTVVQDQAA